MKDEIQKIFDRLAEPDTLTPHEASDILFRAVSYLASLGVVYASWTHEYNKVKLTYLSESKSAVEAKIKAEATVTFQNMKTMEFRTKALEEAIRSLKLFIRTSSEEQKIMPR